MGCANSNFRSYDGLQKPKPPVFMPISLYQKSLLQDSWLDIEKDSVNFGIGLFERLFTSHPEIGPLFPDVKNCQDLLEMRKRQRLNGHPEKIVAVLNEALKAMDDAAIFYAKMEGVGKLMANVGLDLESLKAVTTAFNEQIKETLGKNWSEDVLIAWRDMFSLIIRLIHQGYQGKQRTREGSNIERNGSQTINLSKEKIRI